MGKVLNNPWMIAVFGGAASTIVAAFVLTLIFAGDGGAGDPTPAATPSSRQLVSPTESVTPAPGKPIPSPTPTPTPTPTSMPTPTIIAREAFETGNWVGGVGWLDDWLCVNVEYGSDVFPCGEELAPPLITALDSPHEGSYHLRFDFTNYQVRRVIDLSGQSGVHLQFWVRIDQLGYDSFVECRISPDGTRWDAVATWTPDDADKRYHLVDIDLSPYVMTSQFWIAFQALSPSEWPRRSGAVYIDNITIMQP